MWSDDIDLTLTIDGNVVSDAVIAHASWQLGRQDWFAPLSPSSISVTLRGDHTGSISPGDSLVLSRSSDTLWTGKVGTVALSQVPRFEDEPLDTTTVTGADFVAQLGEARVKGQALSEDYMEEQLSDLLTAAGTTATVERAPSVGDSGMSAWSSYTGTVLDWITTAETYANCMVAVLPDGTIRVCRRDAYPDYGQRVYDLDLEAPNMPGLPTPSSLWRMDETAGSGGIEDWINLRSGTEAGSPTYEQTGPWGSTGPSAIAFQKADAADEFTFGDNFDLADVNTTTWTLAAWVYWGGSGASNSCIMSKITGGNGWTWTILTNGRVRFQAFNASSTVVDAQSANGSIVANTWTHVAIVRSGSSVWPVINGVFGTAATVSGTIPNTAAARRMGSNAGSSEWYDGRLCMVSVWSVALSTALKRLIYLDHVELPTPRSWLETRSITSVINHWLVAGTTYSDATSISTYGRRSFDADDSTSLIAPAGTYPSALRTVMKDPRPIVTATYSVTDGSSVLIDIAPLTLALYDGTLYQVLQVQHDISPDRWDVTLTLDRTQSDMTDGVPLLPV